MASAAAAAAEIKMQWIPRYVPSKSKVSNTSFLHLLILLIFSARGRSQRTGTTLIWTWRTKETTRHLHFGNSCSMTMKSLLLLCLCIELQIHLLLKRGGRNAWPKRRSMLKRNVATKRQRRGRNAIFLFIFHAWVRVQKLPIQGWQKKHSFL